jgi:hypothetical protein
MVASQSIYLKSQKATKKNCHLSHRLESLKNARHFISFIKPSHVNAITVNVNHSSFYFPSVAIVTPHRTSYKHSRSQYLDAA